MHMLRAVLLILIVAAGRATAQQPPPITDPPPKPAPTVPVRDLVPALVEALHDLDAEVRQYAAVALAAIGAEAVEPLIAVLRDKNRDARAAAAYALGLIGAPAVPASAELIKTLKDEESRDVRRQAAQALGRIVAAAQHPATGAPVILAPVPPPPAFPPIDRFRP